ncbi:hypothetical protein QQP08_022961 [Theobroma cacao]|nr:hypothetical protein QQP08_022961 [Theobroma cacao]
MHDSYTVESFSDDDDDGDPNNFHVIIEPKLDVNEEAFANAKSWSINYRITVNERERGSDTHLLGPVVGGKGVGVSGSETTTLKVHLGPWGGGEEGFESRSRSRSRTMFCGVKLDVSPTTTVLGGQCFR